jgi:ABC-type uncharacterized transport system substrate-binding protein
MRIAYRRIGPPCTAVLLLLLAGCAAFGPSAPSPPPEPAAAAEPLPEPAAAPPVVTAPAPTPAPAPAPRAEVAVVVDAGTPTHAAIADEIVAALPPRRYRVTRVESNAAAELAALKERDVTLVAVGADAVRSARAALPNKPLVFCQVPQHERLLGAGAPAWGVHALPPLALQLKSWHAVDPALRTVALIVSASGAPLAEEARRAASTLATDLLVETSTSDRETLYLFRRIAATVDGLWLLPDNDALSPQALRELLSFAASRGIGVLTFNEALLARGALLTATAVPADVAAAVAGLVSRVVAGQTADLPAMTPLSAAALAVNVDAARALGLPPVPVQRWVAREAD